MRIVHTSDIHIDEHNEFDETVRLLDWMANDIHSRKPDVVLIAGDSFPVSVRPSTPLERKAFRTFLNDLSFTHVVVIRGNHDVAEHDVDIFAGEKVHVFSQPWCGQMPGIAIAALPWPSKAFLLKYAEESGKSIDELCRAAMKGILSGFTQQFAKTEGPRIIVGHLNVLGVSFGGFTPLGQDVEVTQEDLEVVGADYIALGHIHKHQMFGNRIAYSGSPRRVDFGEEGERKGYLVVDVERDQLPRILFVETPIRPMQTITVDLGDPFSIEGQRFNPDAKARLIIKMTEEDRAALDMPKLLEQLGGVQHRDLKTDYGITPRQRVRSVEIQQAVTDDAKLDAWLNSLEPKPDNGTRTRLHQQLASLV